MPQIVEPPHEQHAGAGWVTGMEQHYPARMGDLAHKRFPDWLPVSVVNVQVQCRDGGSRMFSL